eukprot:2927515-Alexandrium_andersonii.AAC.1
MTEALTSPGVAPAAKQGANEVGSITGVRRRPSTQTLRPSWNSAPSVSMRFTRKLISSSMSS